MQPNQLTSGDVIADRRADYAKMLDEGGEPDAAAELMEQALELVPRMGRRLVSPCHLPRERSATGAGAIEAYRQTLDSSPDDIFGAQPQACSARRRHDTRPAAEQLCRTPVRRLCGSLRNVAGREAGLQRSAEACRARCRRRAGTIRGPWISAAAPACWGRRSATALRALEGFDLSQNMLAKAAEKHVYDHLAQADLSLAPEATGLFADGCEASRRPRHGGRCADVSRQSGERVRDRFERFVVPGADFAFSVEDAGEGDGFHLAPSLRYCPFRSLCRRALRPLRPRNPRHQSRPPFAKMAANRFPAFLFLTRKSGMSGIILAIL